MDSVGEKRERERGSKRDSKKQRDGDIGKERSRETVKRSSIRRNGRK